ncbi:MAG: thermonuclease family protein [Desulfohalobiaceae bacterium]
MRSWVISALFLALPVLLPSIALSWPGDVVEVIDADILKVRKGSTEVEVRLYGIDAPESDQPYGLRASRFTKMMARFERVEVEPEHRDQHGRVEALVYLDGDGECLNEELVKAGHAWVHERYCHIRDCAQWQKLERRARQAGRGLWTQSDPVPPWDWRGGEQDGSK